MNRISSIDLLRGLAIVFMALDHTRNYFHLGALTGYSDPTNLVNPSLLLFITRFITHFCAPVFVLLAGVSSFLYGIGKSKRELSRYLLLRGLFLIILELTVVNFLWWFDFTFHYIFLQVIWAIGISMVALSLLIYLPKKVVLIVALILIFCHNLLDGVVVNGSGWSAIFWSILHEEKLFNLAGGYNIYVSYPVLPWIGVIALGYSLGELYKKETPSKNRRKLLRNIGLSMIILFTILRGLNIYGDPIAWESYDTMVQSTISFFNLEKYPPSLLFLLITLGPSLLVLAGLENRNLAKTNPLRIFGRTPLFFYVFHLFVIHFLALIVYVIIHNDLQLNVLNTDFAQSDFLDTYGYDLWVTYVVWIGVLAISYPTTRWFMNLKIRNKGKWWVSYI